MKNVNVEAMGVEELSRSEAKNVNGGIFGACLLFGLIVGAISCPLRKKHQQWQKFIRIASKFSSNVSFFIYCISTN